MKSGYKHLSSTDIFSMRADEHDDKPLVITLNSALVVVVVVVLFQMASFYCTFTSIAAAS